MDEKLAARYPFLRSARAFLSEKPIPYEEIEEASNHLLSVVTERVPPTYYGDAASSTRLLALTRLLLFALNDSETTRKYAEARSRQSLEFLRAEGERNFLEVARDFLPSAQEVTERNAVSFSVSLHDYLNAGGALLEADLEQGRVLVDRNDLLPLLRNAVRKRLTDFTGLSARDIPEAAREVAGELRHELAVKQAAPSPLRTGSQTPFLERNCVKTILKGESEGKRYYGSMALAIACLRDGLTREAASEVMKNYAANCARGSRPFTQREALNALDWIYKHPGIGFSCKTLLEQGLITRYCPDCPNVRRAREGRGTRQ